MSATIPQMAACSVSVAGAVLAALLLFWWAQPLSNYPLGPKGFPLFGVLPFLGRNPEQYFCNWSKEHGAVMSVRLGSKTVIILNTYDVIKQVFHDEAFSGRPKGETENVGNNLVSKDFKSNVTSIIQFTKEVLTDFNNGKEEMENLNEEIQYFLKNLKRSGCEPVDLMRHLLCVVTNIMARLTSGHSYDYNDLEFAAIIDAISNKMKPINPFLAISFNCFPFLKHLPFFRDFHINFVDRETKLTDSLVSMVKKKKMNLKTFRGMSDAFHEDKTVFGSPGISDRELQLLVRNFFIAEVESIVIHIQSAVLALLTLPNYYKRIVFEIDSLKVSGGITMKHLDSLPFINAFLAETFRMTTSPAFSLARHVTMATNLSGYHLPEGTEVIANLWAANRDPDVWSNPDVFLPERHLDIDGKFKDLGKMLNFGTGPRSCPGQELARNIVFLVFTNLLHTFTIAPSTDNIPSYNNRHNSNNDFREFQVVLINTYSTELQTSHSIGSN